MEHESDVNRYESMTDELPMGTFLGFLSEYLDQNSKWSKASFLMVLPSALTILAVKINKAAHYPFHLSGHTVAIKIILILFFLSVVLSVASLFTRAKKGVAAATLVIALVVGLIVYNPAFVQWMVRVYTSY